MRIVYTADTHLDWYSSELNPQHPKYLSKLQWYIDQILQPIPADICMIGGDIGHYNQQNIDLLKLLKQIYPEVVVTYGNHDLYLLSNKDRDKYNYSSKARIDEFKQMCSANSIHCLDGDTVTLGGLTVSGLPMWYNLPTPHDIKLWHRFMNDSRHIIEGYSYEAYAYSKTFLPFDTQAFYLEQVAKLQTLPHSDILLTHVCPTILPDNMRSKGWASEEYNIFYESDNGHNVKADYCIFGHSHNIGKFTSGSTQYLTSCIGYPQEAIPSSLTLLEL